MDPQYDNSSEFAEFMWMAEEDQDALDREVMLEVYQNICNQVRRGNAPRQSPTQEEEKFFEDMLAEEEARDTVYFAPTKNGVDTLQSQFMGLRTSESQQSAANRAPFKFNPQAQDFVPKAPPPSSSNGSSSDVPDCNDAASSLNAAKQRSKDDERSQSSPANPSGPS